MPTGILPLVALSLLAVGRPAFAAQTSPGPPSVEQLARRADLVVIGEVVSAVGAWDAARTSISTRIELAVTEVLKGAPASRVTFAQPGGQVGDQISTVAGAATFQPGERVLVFLEPRQNGSLGLADLTHGKFRVERDAATGHDDAVRATGAPGADRIPLDRVRARVRRVPGGSR